MQKTPESMRKQVVLVGETNAGKSTLFNALTGQERSIVSDQPGTTTDPVRAALELVPFGPVVLIDTAGLGDSSLLGEQRMYRTELMMRRADAGIYVADAEDFSAGGYQEFQKKKLPHLLVFTKSERLSLDSREALSARYPSGLFFQPEVPETVEVVRTALSRLLSENEIQETSLIGDLLSPGSTVILVVPIDSEAPKGRLILPQVQVLRDCLDHGVLSLVVKETELEAALQALHKVDLIITDSQVFDYVEKRIPKQVSLTSFSMLLARQKGNFQQLLKGTEAIHTLPEGGRVLMLEGCTHNHTHEDIGRNKIPAMLQRITGKKLQFEYYSGYDFPKELGEFDLAVQCGGCMLNHREILVRLEQMEEMGLPVTNYGMLLAFGSGILSRSCQPFPEVK